MLDLVYLLAIVAFFAAMLGYVRGCERLGRDDAVAAEGGNER